MSDLGKVRHVLQAISHIGAAGEWSYMPWTGNHDQGYPYVGWRLEFLNQEQQPLYIYLYPQSDAERPTVGIYMGPYGDHTKDRLVGEAADET